MTTSSVGSTSGSIQFTGLASGLDTASIISQLMSVESAPQTALKNRMATEQSQVSVLQTINSTLASLGTAAGSFLTGSTWTQLAATSSNSNFSVTAASSATPANVSVTVNQSASSASALLSGAALGGVTAGSTYTITSGGKATAFTVGGTGSMSDVAAAINASTKTSGLQAVIIDPTGASPTLELVSTATGAASNFSITDSSGTALVDSSSTATATGITTHAGADAQLTVDGVAMTSASNTVTVMPGVQVTIPGGVTSAAPASSTISVTDDGSARATAMNTFVGQINDLLTTIASETAYGSITAGSAATGAGVLAGNADLRNIATQLVNTIFSPGNTVSLNAMGLSVDTDGQLTFDSSAFKTAYQNDPQGVQDAFTGSDGFITRVQTVATQASDAYDGTLTATITSMNSEITDYGKQISDWDDRLAMKQASLETTYANLETQLSTMQSQQSWLSSQISSLDGGWAQNS